MKKYFLFLFLILAITGCASTSNVSVPTNLEPVTLKLKWVHQAQFAGHYVAKEKGFYQGEGLDVSIEPFSFDDPTIQAVAEGRAEFGITGADALVEARANGLPIKAVAVIYRISSVCAYTLKESGISKPQDLIGKKLGMEPEKNIKISIGAMLNEQKIDSSLIKEVEIGYDASELLAGEVDASTGYIINEPHQAIEAGHEVITMLAADYGANMYADVLFTHDNIIKNNPNLVKGFVKATLDGWQYAISNEKEAIDYTLKYATDRARSHEAYMLKESVPLVHAGNIPLGFMEENEWIKINNILIDNKIINKKVASEDLFTNDFIK